MFGKLKGVLGKTKNVVLAPVQGEVCPLSEVKDPTFSTEMLGRGVSIKPERGRIVAPADGVITTLFETKHAVSITTDFGAEILIHVGLDTVKLKGKYFVSYAETDDRVKKGDLLIEFDMDNIKKAGYEVITPVVICNSDRFPNMETTTGQRVKELDEIIRL
ncbi:PTS glucose transporter subunit IIA [Blautia liquoris]|jgi:PTS system beta-glucosides-specific IIC component|uniref:PTS glucose transporter subunit IIA n=1 Tax=Blautia liquoris TaxID=2779518 RepID=A0A7M2RKL9_9FIRM|nr:PTS glucose transporter subunit IIA [Blautia liquoris]QOV19892.1 PTS glucose transporter subunit IIA [Blautia liquoris]